MTVLAYHKPDLMTSEELASSIRTNPTVIRRLVSKLVEAGLLETFKGKAGGIRMTKSPKEITLKDIYEAVLDKKLMATPCKEPYKQCVVSCNMGTLLSEVAEGIEQNSMRYLSGIKLSDLASQIK